MSCDHSLCRKDILKFNILRVGTCNNKLFIKREMSLAYLDLQIARKTNLQSSRQRQKVVAYFARAMRHYRDKEMLVIPFNMGNHCVTLSISAKYD
jgi:hypothetical protein